MSSDQQAQPTPGVPDDAALALGVAAGDDRALAAVYDRYGGRLLAFCESLLTDPAQAQLALTDVFVIAAERLRDLPVPTQLRPWLFAVARHVCQSQLALEPQPVEPVPVVEDAPIDLFAAADFEDDAAVPSPAPVMDERPAERLVLELADRQQLRADEVALATGVATVAAPSIIARARRDNRRSRGVILGPGRTFAPEMIAVRPAVLAAAAGAGPGAGAGIGTDGWVGGWPPGDPAIALLADGHQRRRWGAPLAALVVLLLALGAIIGVLATAGGGHPAADIRPSTSTGATGPFDGSTSSLATAVITPPDPATSAPSGGGVVAPPTPSQPRSSTTSATTTATTTNGNWTLVVTTDQHAVQITAGRAQASCSAKSTCSYQLANATVITVADTNGGHGAVGAASDTFSAPPSCTNKRGSCTFAVTSNLVIVLTTPGIVPRAG